MNKHNILVFLRSFYRKPLIPILNLFGLSVGLGCFLVISLYLYQENSYETGFENYDRVYRVEEQFLSMGQVAWTTGNIPHKLADVPYIEAQTRVGKMGMEFNVRVNNESYKLKHVLSADSSFFDLFDYEFIYGSKETALKARGHVVLSEETAIKLFGRTDVMGERMSHPDFGEFQVNGVVALGQLKSHLDFELLTYRDWEKYTTSKWFGIGGYSYVRLVEGSTQENLNAALLEITETDVFPVIYKNGLASDDPMTFEEWLNSANKVSFSSKHITDIYLNSHLQFEMGPNGDKQTRTTMLIVGVFVLLIAAINFMNLSMAAASTRVKEIGVKKALGSGRASLVRQYLSQSIVFTSVASLLGAGFSEIFIRLINMELGEVISISLVSKPDLIIWLCLFVLSLGLVAGLYPALFLSGAKTIPLLKGKSIGQVLNMKSANAFRNALVITQFTISSALIASSIVVFQQLKYLQEVDRGMDDGQVLVINNGYDLGQNKEAFKNKILTIPGIEDVSFTERLPADGSNSTLSTMLDSETTLTFAQFFVDEQFSNALGLELIKGEWFTKEKQSYDSVIVVNEAAVRALGYDDPVGQTFGNYYTIQGVVKDFKYGGLKDEVAPVVLTLSKRTPNRIAIKMNLESVALSDVEKIWSDFSELNMNANFLDQNFADQIAKEKQSTDAVLVFTILAILIAAIGLFGLAAFNAEQRRHEFGVRRVLGANFKQIAQLFSFQFVKLIAVAFAISIPISIYGLQQWLNGFADRTGITVFVFLGAALITIFITMATLLFQSIKVSQTNPVDTLRDE